MAAAISHRGPDDEGFFQDPDAPLLLGHRRLSILDLSPEGHQPMMSASGRYTIVFNGEIYNFQDIRAELKAMGIRFRGRSDTEVMLAAFDRWGVVPALKRFNGMFAVALWDRAERTLHLVRDRLGKKPLYVGRAGDALVFASELKALRAHPDFTPAINREALTLYMRYACVPAPYSIYQGVWQLLPGTHLSLKAGPLDPGADLAALMESYWQIPQAVANARRNPKVRSDEQALAEFETLFTACVRERMVADVPLGAFLSGGVDSSAVVAVMQRCAGGQKVKTFTIGFREAGFGEAAHAAKIAAHLGTDHHELYLGAAEARAIIPDLPRIYDEPFADISQIPTILVAKFARQHVTVALSGDGGDELLGGYLRHTLAPRLWGRVKHLPPLLRRAMACALQTLPAPIWDQLIPGHPQLGERLYKAAEIISLPDPESIYRHLASQWTDPAALVIGGAEPKTPLTDPANIVPGLSFAERMMMGDALSYLPNDVLTKVDRATMSAGLESRAPLLDRRLFDYVWGLPEDMKIRNNQGKWLLRQLLARHVPPALFERPKQGFTVPVAAWLRGPLKDWAGDLLSVDNLNRAGYLNAGPIEAAWKEHLAGRGRHAHKLWTALMFQSWLERWG